MENFTVTGRFAPTPSGRMHLGNVFCSLLSWLFCPFPKRKDRPSNRGSGSGAKSSAYAKLLEEDLNWLGLDWDEGGSDGGPAGPYFQSERTEIYCRCLEGFREMGLLYPCFCSRAELHAAEAPHYSDGRFIYTGRCRNLKAEEIQQLSKSRKPAIRIRVPEEIIVFEDLHYGPQRELLSQECGDFIVRRADGVFAYQLAAAVDDALMGVTEVVRGNDLLSSSPRQIWIQQTLGFPSPRYGHVPLLVASDGRRLSKRDGDLDLGILRQRFPHPEPILGFLGWLAGLLEKPEPVCARELIPVFSWNKIPKNNITLDSSMLLELN